MDKRSFIAGLGIGIIVGALMLQLFTIGEKSQEQLKSIEQQINSQEDASANGADADQLQEEQLEDNSEAAPVATEAPQKPDVNSPDITPPEVEQVEEPKDPKEEAKLDDEHVPPVVDQVASESFVVRIKPFTSLSEAANLLESNKLVNNKNEFVDYFIDKKDNIRAGYFLVNSNSTLSELHKIFTSTPLIESEVHQKIEIDQIKLIE